MPVCQCPDSGLTAKKRTLSNGVVHWGFQCDTCGKWTSRKKETFDQEPDEEFDESIGNRYWEERRQAVVAEQRARDQAWWDCYNAYLQSPRWQSKRAEILKRDNYICQGCLGYRGVATQVHHLTYSHVGNELAFELISLCDECHEQFHNEGAAW